MGMTKIFSTPVQIAFLWLVILITAISVAYISHLCREKYSELAVLESEENGLQIDYGRYLLEASAWGSLQRIETLAIDQFVMHTPKPDEIVIVRTPN